LPATSVALRRNAWFTRLAQVWDGANQWWQEHVVEFSLRSQLNLLEKLGIRAPQWQHLGWAFSLGLIGWVAWVALALRRSVARGRPDRLGRAWLRMSRELARVAPPRVASEGPLEYARRVGGVRPDLADRVTALAQRYARLRFGPSLDPGAVAELERDIRRLTL
jgi:hypothetical protein